MNSVRTVFSICAQNFRKWAADYRMWVIAVLLIVMTFLFADDVHKNAAALGSDTSVWIFPFLYLSRYMKLVFTLPVVLMFCNAPFTDKNQTFVMMRTSRVKWLCGQILYVFLASAVYYLFIFFFALYRPCLRRICRLIGEILFIRLRTGACAARRRCEGRDTQNNYRIFYADTSLLFYLCVVVACGNLPRNDHFFL